MMFPCNQEGAIGQVAKVSRHFVLNEIIQMIVYLSL